MSQKPTLKRASSGVLEIHYCEAGPADGVARSGTSISKAFGALRRSAEDIDLSFDRADLGYTGIAIPIRVASARSWKERACQLDMQRQPGNKNPHGHLSLDGANVLGVIRGRS